MKWQMTDAQELSHILFVGTDGIGDLLKAGRQAVELQDLIESPGTPPEYLDALRSALNAVDRAFDAFCAEAFTLPQYQAWRDALGVLQAILEPERSIAEFRKKWLDLTIVVLPDNGRD